MVPTQRDPCLFEQLCLQVNILHCIELTNIFLFGLSHSEPLQTPPFHDFASVTSVSPSLEILGCALPFDAVAYTYYLLLVNNVYWL